MDKKRIGLPRALLYFHYGDFWRSLLDTLGYEVITSPETTAHALKEGVRSSIGDFCLPVKIFLGHIETLKNTVDFLFIPRYVSVDEDSYLCPKLIGLPDVVRACCANIPEIVAPILHRKRDGERASAVFAEELARALRLKRAKVERAVLSHASSRAVVSSAGFSIHPGAKRLQIGIVGRDYLLYDQQVGGRILRTLRDLDVSVISPVPDEMDIREAMTVIPKRVYWNMGKEVVASAHALFKDASVAGVINLSSIACGPDSFTNDLIRRQLNQRNKPYMSVSVDEHTSDVGLQTRLEAFVDMLMKVTA